MEKVKESMFQFKNVRIMDIKFNRIDELIEGEYEINISRNVEITNLLNTESDLIKKVTLELRIESKVFKLDAKICGDFRSDVTDETQNSFLFEQNAPTLLLSYLRPIISVITSQAQMNYDLPFLDFIK